MCSANENQNLDIQIVSVPGEGYMLTPGEVRQIALDYFLFHSILQTGSTLFGCVNVEEWSTSTDVMVRGSLLSIMSVKNVVPDSPSTDDDDVRGPPSPKIMVECKCSGRFDVHRLIDEAADKNAVPEPWKLLRAECAPVRDWSCWDAFDRQNLATKEWDVWQTCRDVASLVRKLRPPTGSQPMVEQELAVWAPAAYDREITADEWAKTPSVTREVWCQRAEAFSFGILRCMESDEQTMRQARQLTNTSHRLDLAVECMEKKRAMTTAQLSLKNALN